MKSATFALTVAASMLAASTATLATTSSSFSTAAASYSPGGSNEGNSSYVVAKICVAGSSEKEKFAPRFDGLRFIETLVTAHR